MSNGTRIIIKSSLFQCNIARGYQGGHGGAIYLQTSLLLHNAGSLYLKNTSFIENTAIKSGGAIFVNPHQNKIFFHVKLRLQGVLMME